MKAHDLDWEDCTGTFQVNASIADGGGVWPSLVSVNMSELSVSITAGDARDFAELLLRAANACDESTAQCQKVTQDNGCEVRCRLRAGHRGTHRARVEAEGCWGREIVWGTNDEYADGWRAALGRS